MTCVKHCMATGLIWGVLLLFPLIQPCRVAAEAVKTYYKQYSIFTFEDQDYLCEPYEVKKGDWLYKIFRQKGEISGDNFDKFIRIFRKLNPKLSNIDAIEPGHQILIPLKQVKRQTYTQREKGIVEVPVLEFSQSPDEEMLAKLIRSHIVKKGDTLSTIMDSAFLDKNNTVSDTGKRIFKDLNPDITDGERLQIGAQVLIPDPAILSQPWLGDFMSWGASGAMYGDPGKGEDIAASSPSAPGDSTKDGASDAPKARAYPPLPMMPLKDFGRLRRYATLIQATLSRRGKIVFPGVDGRTSQVLDLGKTPLLTEKSGLRTVIMPPGVSPSRLNQDLVLGMKAYWKELKIQEINEALKSTSFSKKPPLENPTGDLDPFLNRIVKATPYTLRAPTPMILMGKPLAGGVSLARITHPEHPDILVNPDSLRDMNLARLKAAGYPVVTLSPDLPLGESLKRVFEIMGYKVWIAPPINSGHMADRLPGVLAEGEGRKLFITPYPLAPDTKALLKSQGIKQIVLKEDN